MRIRSIPAVFAAAFGLLLAGRVGADEAAGAQPTTVRSPDGHVAISLSIANGAATYRVTYRDRVLLSDSPLGMTFQQGGSLSQLKVTDVRRDAHDETYAIVVGKSSSARDHYNQATVALAEAGDGGRRVEMVFRAYDDGVAFRYNLPEQPGLGEFAITSEETGFCLPPAATAWVLPIRKAGDHYEYLYRPTKVADLPRGQLIGFPLLVEMPDDGPAFAISEANLTDYAGMAVVLPKEGPANVLRGSLTPLPGQTEVKVKGKAPHASPWRAILIGDSPGRLIESNLIYNLNEACKLADTSWIRPGKVAFLWWNGYLVGKNGKRGAVDTATFKHYVDGAAEMGFAYSSIDGLDIAWYGGKIPGYGENDVTVPVKELDMRAVLDHARAKGVRIRLWVASQGLRKYLDKALDTYEKWGVEGIMVDFIERDDQEAINWIREVVEKAAAHHLTVTLHNVSKPTGLERTYPNLLTREAVRNQEYDKWDPVGLPPAHNLTVPFTRMLAGPLDYHSGAFRSARTAEFMPRDVAPDVMGTRCQQLAMYVVYENPMPMAVDYPAAYRGRPGAEFLTLVPTTWDETRFVGGAVGRHITVARRKGDDWYVGAMTDDTPRGLKVPLTFLGGGTYTAEVWCDDPANGMNALVRRTVQGLTSRDSLSADLAAAGGCVVRLRPSGTGTATRPAAP